MTITEQFKAKRCVFSIECFPPKQTTQMDKLKDTLRQMQAMDPGFISVTFGAGGSAGGVSTAEVADYIQNELHVPTLAHLICMGNDETRAAEILDQLESVGVRDVLALRGDRTPSRPESPDFKHASDLTSFIKWKKPEFSVHGACYPEGHPEADSLLHDVENLRIKQAAGAEHLLTQLFQAVEPGDHHNTQHRQNHRRSQKAQHGRKGLVSGVLSQKGRENQVARAKEQGKQHDADYGQIFFTKFHLCFLPNE